MANAKMRAAKEAAEANQEPPFKNLPVRPKSIPVDVPAGYRFTFCRLVALEILENVTGEDIKTTGMDKMSNAELREELLAARIMYPEFLGDVVDDGKPNGIMPYPQHFKYTPKDERETE